MRSRRWRAGARRHKGRGLRPVRTFADRERERWQEFIRPERRTVTREMALDAGMPELEGMLW